jgi:hypothetical protein
LTNPSNWGSELRLTSSSFNLLNTANAGGWFLGDYEGLAAAGNNFEAFFSEAGSAFPQAHIFARQILAGPGNGSASPSAGSSTSPTPVIVPVSSLAGPTGFLAPVSYPVGTNPVAVAVGDFNNDANPDLVVADSSDNTVSVLLNNGDATFQAQVKSGVGKSPVGVAVGDFNHDGNLDIVTANEGSSTSNANSNSSQGSLSVTLGKGDGTFPNTTNYLLPNVIANQLPQPQFHSTVSIAVGDLNHDGNLDVVLATSDEGKGWINVFLGRGDGSFKELPPFPINSADPTSLALADVNGDGNLDIVAGNFSSGPYSSVLLGNGDGTFQETSNLNTGTFDTNNVATADFNKDGIPDLVTTGESLVNGRFHVAVNVLLGTGTGAFGTPQTLLPGSFPGALAVADFNHDGNLDILTVNDTIGTISVFLGNGTDGFPSVVNLPSPVLVVHPGGVAVGDFNRDGFPDLAVTDISSNTVDVLINSGTWDPPAPTATTAGTALTQSGTSAASVGTTVTRPASLAPAMPSETVVAALDWFLAELGQEAQPDSGLLTWAVTGRRRPAGSRMRMVE